MFLQKEKKSKDSDKEERDTLTSVRFVGPTTHLLDVGTRK